jgi:phage major head subunit gpT-like protein
MLVNALSLALLSQAVDMRFNAGLQTKITDPSVVSMEVPSGTAENIYPYWKELGDIRQWIGDRVIQNISKGDFKIANVAYEMTKGILREYIEDDVYGIYGPEFELMGKRSAQFRPKKSFELLKAGDSTLCPDGQYFFDVDHPVGAGIASNSMGGAGERWYVVDANQVYKPIIWQPRKAFNLVKLFSETDANVFMSREFLWGIDGRFGIGFSPFWQLAFQSRQTLDATNLKATLVAMASQKNDAGVPLGVMGSHLVVSPTLMEAANDLINKDRLANGETNTLQNRLQVVVAAELL